MLRIVGNDDRRTSNEENDDDFSSSQSQIVEVQEALNNQGGEVEVGSPTTTRPGPSDTGSCCLMGLGDDIFHLIASYLDPVDLSLLDGCCSTTQRLCKHVWQQKLQSNVTATSHAWVDLRNDVTLTKSLTILDYRAKRFAMKIENRRRLLMIEERKDDGEEDSADDSTNPGSHIFPIVEVHTFREPTAYYFFVRLSAIANDANCISSNNTRREQTNIQPNKHNIVLWEGFSTPIEQGAWGDSTILFFHLKEISKNINWTRPIKDAFSYSQQPDLGNDDDDDDDSITENTQKYQTRIKSAFNDMALTIVAFCRRDQKPGLVVFSIGLSSVSRDNRMYYRIQGQHCRRRSSSSCCCQQESSTNTEEKAANTTESCWVYPTLITNRFVSTRNESTELLGIRVVCNGIA